MTLVADYHLHTVLCKHAIGQPSDFEKRAFDLGLCEIGFSDHMPSVDGYDPKHRMVLEEFPRYLEMIQELAQKANIPIRLGIEADYYTGCEAFLEKWLSSQDFDFVLGSIHFLDGWGFDDPEQLPVWERVDVSETWERYFVLQRKLVETGLFDVVAHMDLPKKFGHSLYNSSIKRLVEPVLDLMALKGMTLEVNTSGLRRPVQEMYPSRLILSMAKERGIPICFGSDAHRPEEVGFGFEKAIRLVKELGFSSYVRFRQREKIFWPLP
jgi:histidinol-phosphatase (PHP family)